MGTTLGVGRRIHDAEGVAQAVGRLAANIAADYRRQPLRLIGVLKGALCFTADLARALAVQEHGPSEISVDYICVGRNGGRALGTPARVLMDPSLPVAGANVVAADGIADHGQTFAFVKALLQKRGPASLRTCVLFDKPAQRKVDMNVDYVGLSLGDVFAIGYGLDYKELYRNLPYLAELREDQTV